MKNYLGEKVLDIYQTIYSTYSPKDWVLLWIEMYGGIDGAHHKNWLLDQIARILHGTKVIAKLAEWDNGQQELRFELGEATPEYHKWVAEICAGEDGPNTYSYDTGVAP